MFANYHNHTYRCGHGKVNVTDEDYVLAAIEAGFKIMGFSDHNPMPAGTYDPQPGVRMTIEEFPQYIASIEHLQEKYQDQIRIYKALECEYSSELLPWLKEIRPQFDYLITGTHWHLGDHQYKHFFQESLYPEQIRTYTDITIEAMETGLFIYLAHPDVVLADYPKFDNACIDSAYAICRKAKELGMPMGYNQYGMMKKQTAYNHGLCYPYQGFWEIAAEVGATAIIELDAHRPSQYLNKALLDQAAEELAQLGVSVVDTLPGLE